MRLAAGEGGQPKFNGRIPTIALGQQSIARAHLTATLSVVRSIHMQALCCPIGIAGMQREAMSQQCTSITCKVELSPRLTLGRWPSHRAQCRVQMRTVQHADRESVGTSYGLRVAIEAACGPAGITKGDTA